VKHVLPSIRIWLAVAAVVTAAAFLLSYRSIRQSEVSTAAVEHTQQTFSALVALEGTIANLIFASGDEAVTRAL
jgi:CHASE3 domain sensor protein